MKKLLAIILVAMMLLSSVALTACDLDSSILDLNDVSDTLPKNTESESDTQPVKETDIPTAVDTVNGLKPLELFYNMKDTVAVATVYEMSFSVRYKTEMAEYGIDFKKAASSAYCKEYGTEYSMETWYVDGVYYMTDGEDKIKDTQSTLEDCFGYILELKDDIAYMFDDVDSVVEKITKAQLYSLGGKYYFDIAVTDEEGEEFEGAANIRFTFDKDGDIKSVRIDAKEMCATYSFISIGSLYEVSAPVDAYEYITWDEYFGDSGNEPDTPIDPVNKAHEMYLKAFDTIENMQTYEMILVMTDSEGYETIMEYTAATNGGYYLVRNSDESFSQFWLIDGVGYINSGSYDEGTAVKTTESDEIETIEQFLDIADIMRSSLLLFEIDSAAFDGVEAVTDQFGTTFEVAMNYDEDGYTEYYSFYFNKQGEIASIDITSEYTDPVFDGCSENASYSFGNIDEVINLTVPTLV